MLYTVFPRKSSKELDPIWDMGCKLYIQISKMCFFVDVNAHSYIHYLISWPIKSLVQAKWKVTVHRGEIKRKEQMARTLLLSFFNTMSADKERDKYAPSLSSSPMYKIFWFNMVHVIFYIEELIVSYGISCRHNSEVDSPGRSKGVDNTFLEEVSHNLLDGDYEGTLFYDIKRGLFFSK